MARRHIKNIIMLLVCLILVSCARERRVDGEMAFDSTSLMNMAESFLQAGDYSNAMRLFQRAANENPEHIPSRLGLAKSYQALGASDAAINFYDQVLRLDPDNMDAKMGSGQMLITRNRPADAIPYLKELTKRDPKNYRIYNMLGLAHDLLGQQEEAQMNYGRGLELERNNISLLNNLALSFAFEGQYAPAIRLLGKAINLDYSVTKAQQNLVLVYVLSGEEEAGRKIGADLMTAEEMNNNIRHYKWVKSLSPGERAQAIFLGVRQFPKKAGENIYDEVRQAPAIPDENIPDDPKKRALMEILKQENTTPPQSTENVPEAAPDRKAAKKATKKATKKTGGTRPSEKIYRVQLGAYPNLKITEIGWQKIKKRSKDILAPYKPLIKLVTLANGKTLFRLFVRDIEDRNLAKAMCDQLGNRKIDCLVLKTTKE